jgi:hypothetical protein
MAFLENKNVNKLDEYYKKIKDKIMNAKTVDELDNIKISDEDRQERLEIEKPIVLSMYGDIIELKRSVKAIEQYIKYIDLVKKDNEPTDNTKPLDDYSSKILKEDKKECKILYCDKCNMAMND